MAAAFHLNNQEAKRELKVYNNNKTFTILSNPCLSRGKIGQITHVLSPSTGIMQKTILTHHTAETTSRPGWVANAKTLCTATLFLVYSTAEYCAPV